MKWVVGTGRCGLHNYTALHGGFIQSNKDWKQLVIRRHHGEEWNRAHVEEVFKWRMGLDYPCIADCSQFMFIDVIREVDPEAEFVWLIRNREDCIKSFMRRIGEDDRIHPKGWEFKTERKRELIEWYYDEVNLIIAEKLMGAKYEKLSTEDMPRAKDVDYLSELARTEVFS